MLSVILYGRNDSHGYNLHKRAAVSLNCIARVLDDPDDEMVFVDYNTPPELPTFIEAIRDTLTEEAIDRLRVIRVPTWVHRERFADRTHLLALEPIARNVALRRANPRNHWVLSTNTDMLFVPRAEGASLTSIVAGLGDRLYELPRFELPEVLWEALDRRDPDVALALVGEWGPALHLNEATLSHEWNRFDAPGDFQLASRERLVALDGFDEEMLLGWHVDSNLCRRFWLLDGPPGDLSEALWGFHCDHLRQATAMHEVGAAANDLDRFMHDVLEPELPGQRDSWGLADVELEEVDLRRGASARLPEALRAVLPPPLPVDPVEDGMRAFTMLAYRAAHVLPYVADAISTLPPTAIIAYVGSDSVLRELLSRLVTELSFSAPLRAVIVQRDAPLVALDTELDDLEQSADAVVFELGTPADDPEVAPATFGTWPRPVRFGIGRALYALDRLAARDRARAARGSPRERRYLVVNASSNQFEKFVDDRLVLTRTVFSTRMRHGIARTELPEPGTEYTEPHVYALLRSHFGYELDDLDEAYEPGTTIDLTDRDGGVSYLESGWSTAEPWGTWTDEYEAVLGLALPAGADAEPLVLSVTVTDFMTAASGGSQEVEVSAGGVTVERWRLRADEPRHQVRRAVLPVGAAGADGRLQVALRVAELGVPRELGWTTDPRRLGVRVASVRVEPLSASVPLGKALDLAETDPLDQRCWTGWSYPEVGGRWTEGPTATLMLEPDPAPAGAAVLTLDVSDVVVPAPGRPQVIELRHAGELIDLWYVGESDRREVTRHVLVPARIDERHPLRVDVAIGEPTSPLELGLGPDRRELGLLVRCLTIEAADLGLGLGEQLDLRAGATRPAGARCWWGWSHAEPDGRWTDGTEAVILVAPPVEPGRQLDVELHVVDCFVPPDRATMSVIVCADGSQLDVWELSAEAGEHVRRVRVPALGPDGVLRVTLAVEGPASPAELGLGGDPRHLGVKLAGVTLLG